MSKTAWGTLAAACVVVQMHLFSINAQQPIQPVPMTPFADGQASLLNADLEGGIAGVLIAHDYVAGREHQSDVRVRKRTAH
jgi:hypothetical protein